MSRRTCRIVARWSAAALVYLLSPIAAFAADGTPPTRPIVTDDGTYTGSGTTLHATWTSADPESGIAEYQYQIRRDSTSGTILVNWTSTGTTPSVTRTGLSLTSGKRYYFGVKAKNGVGLWSTIGYSNGILVDTTAPSVPGTPTEGGATDLDFDTDGKYSIAWPAAADAESGVAAYELQERIGPLGAWATLTTTSYRSFTVSGRAHNTQCFYQVRAKNKAGFWGPWSSASDGILVDKTAPTTPSVADDGAITPSATSLHAAWTGSDPESGLAESQYMIRQDSPSGAIIVNWTSVGTATAVTKVGLSLTNGKSYFVGVKAKNGAGLWSAAGYSDGITVQADTGPPVGTVTINGGAVYATTPAVTLTLSATDDSGTVSQMQFSNDGLTYSTPEAYAATKSWTLAGGDGVKTVSVKFRDPSGNWSSPVSDSITLDTTPPAITITFPMDGSVLGAQ